MQRNEILALLRKHGVHPTTQRLEVADILLARPQHLSAEQVIDRLRTNGSSISKATVYNTLNLFEEVGLVKERLVDPARRFFDSTTAPHHHFYNEDTGELKDIPTESLEIENLPELPAGTELLGAELIIRVRNTRD